MARPEQQVPAVQQEPTVQLELPVSTVQQEKQVQTVQPGSRVRLAQPDPPDHRV